MNTCLKCGKIGTEQTDRVFRDKGRMIKVIHSDGSEPCSFVEYPSITQFLNRNRTNDRVWKGK